MKKTWMTAIAVASLLAACSKPVPPQWQRISAPRDCPAVVASPATPACAGDVFFLDVVNIEERAGLYYVTMQTRGERDTSGAFGLIHAEANCSSRHLEPTALQEDRYDATGQKLAKRLTPISAADEAAIVDFACGRFGK
jgi:hypothetical protein